MHGRLKVRSTAEQEERKRIEREKKLALYKQAMNECFTRIKSLQYDKVGLHISEDVLLSNGDIQTLWSFRKNILEELEKTEVGAEQSEQSQLDKQNELGKLYSHEMQLTELCLKKNAKSYSSWHHRQWCLIKANGVELNLGSKFAQLSWDSELKLCSNFLSLDERNFHCWKHRMFVVKSGSLSKQVELEFTYEKICSNFSNYSAWHYRSKLIECLYKENQVDSKIFGNEIELVENAIYT
jgi:geranylgeranyl transferase type-2 subunit alpha